MKKILDFLKAIAAFVVILDFLFVWLASVIAQLFPAVLPEWLHTMLEIIGLVFSIVLFVAFLIEWYRRYKAKKAAKRMRPRAKKPSND